MVGVGLAVGNVEIGAVSSGHCKGASVSVAGRPACSV